MRPILFETIKRAAFEKLINKKKNYLIKEEDGTTSKYIAGLEGINSGAFILETEGTPTSQTDATGLTVTNLTFDEAVEKFRKGEELVYFYQISQSYVKVPAVFYQFETGTEINDLIFMLRLGEDSSGVITITFRRDENGKMIGVSS